MNKMYRNKFNKGDGMFVLQDFKTLNNKVEHDTKYMEIVCSEKKKERERKKSNIIFMDWKINIVKLSIILKTIWKFNEIPAKIPMAFFTESEQKPYNLFGIKKEPK